MSKIWDTLADEANVEKTAEILQKNGFDTVVVATGKDALAKLESLIPEKAEVMLGSSKSLIQIGFTDLVAKNAHDWENLQAEIQAENDPIKRADLRRKTHASDYFVASVNAVTEDGKLIAVDASGSRTSSIAFAAEHVILVVSTKKIVKDLETAMQRIREHVVPQEDVRLMTMYKMHTNTNKWMILEQEWALHRITVILVKEDLGF